MIILAIFTMNGKSCVRTLLAILPTIIPHLSWNAINREKSRERHACVRDTSGGRRGVAPVARAANKGR